MRNLCIGLLSLVLLGCGQQRDLQLGFVAAEPAPAIAAALRSGLSASMTVELTPYETPAAVMDALRAGDLDLAIVEHPSAVIEGVGVVSSLYPSVLHLISQQPDACGSTAGLDGLQAAVNDATVYPGPVGSSGYRLLMELSAVGVIHPAKQLEILDNVFGELPQTFVEFGGVLPVDALKRLDGYCLVSLGSTSEPHQFADALSLRYPNVEPFTIPAGLYPQLAAQPVQTLAVRSLLVARSDLDDDLAFDLAEAVAGAASSLGHVYPLARAGVFAPLEPAQLNLPVLPGARRFLDGDAPGFIERHAETLALILTLIVTLSSASVALLGRYRQSKKDHLDRYFDQLIALQAQVDGATDSDRDNLLAQLDAETAAVIALLGRERINADAALVAYLQLGDRVRRSLDDLNRRQD